MPTTSKNNKGSRQPTVEELSTGFQLKRDSLVYPTGYRHAIDFAFASDLADGTHRGLQEWCAALYVYTRDVPLLMRQGFDLAEENVIQKYGYCVSSCEWNVTAWSRLPGDKYAVRRYILADQSEACRWTACLIVGAPDRRLDLLSRFSLSDLRAGTVESCQAYNAAGWTVYLYNYCYPINRINCIYGEDVHLNGMWPWPKRDVKEVIIKDGNITETTLEQDAKKGDDAKQHDSGVETDDDCVLLEVVEPDHI